MSITRERSPFPFLKGLACALLALALSSSLAAGETLDVGVTVFNPLGVERVNEPVTMGIPIPEDLGIQSCQMLNMLDSSGKPVPSQFVVTARWGGGPDDSDRPVKWVLVTFMADVPPAGTSLYFLKSGAVNETSTGLDIVSNTDRSIEISTGKACFTIGKEHFRLFDKVSVGDRTITLGTENGIYLKDEQGKIFTSFYGSAPTVTVREAGPVRIVLRVEGELADSESGALLDYQAFLYFYADKGFVRVLLTLGNHGMAMPREDGSGYDVYDYYGQNSVTFEEASVQIQLDSPGDAPTCLYPVESGLRTQEFRSISIYQDSSGTDYWDRYTEEDHPRTNSYSRFRGYRVIDGEDILAAGDHFSGWLDISGDSTGLTVGILDFWQNFPKALCATDSGLVTLKPFPSDYGSPYNFRVGEEKTTEMVFLFHADADNSGLLRLAESLLKPMTALAPSEWYIRSAALQGFIPEPGTLEDRFGRADNTDDTFRYAYYNDRTLMADPEYTGPDSDYYPYDTLWISTENHPGSIDYFNFYGWAWWGNQPLDFEAYGDGKAGPFNVKYHFDYGAWIQFLRTGDLRWHDMAEAFTRHLELLMLNNVTTQYDQARWRNAVFGMSAHMETGNSNGTRNRLGPVMDTCFGAPGALLHYYLTGYPRSEEFLVRVGNYAFDFYSTTRRYEASPYLADSFYSDGTRPMANLLKVLNEAFRYSGNRKYQALAQDVMDYFAPEKQPWINGPVPGNDNFISSIFLMMYINDMAEYALLTSEYQDLAEQSALAKERVVRFVDWLLAHCSFTYEGWLTTWYHYHFNGENEMNGDMINNWLLEFADACAYAYGFTGKTRYLDAARRFFHTGVNNPFYMGSALTYSDAKEAVNHAVFGHVYMYYARYHDPAKGRAFLPSIILPLLLESD